MAEVMVRDGTWAFDGDLVRIVPGGGKRVQQLRQALGELTVPLAAIAGIAVEPGRRGGRLRLRLRDGADPFLQVVGGKLDDDADPYRLSVDQQAMGAAEYLVDEVRNALIIEQVTPAPCTTYLMRGPTVPLSATAGDGSVSFDGSTIRIEWTEWAESVKSSAGPQEIALADVTSVEWMPIVGWTNGFLRFRVTGASALAPKHDLYSTTWGMQKLGGLTSLLASAVVARLPHPNALQSVEASATPEPPEERRSGSASGSTSTDGREATASTAEIDHDTLLRRLRELGDLHSSGVLTDDEFAAAKAALLRRF